MNEKDLFIQRLRRINTDELIYSFASKSIQMFKDDNYLVPIKYPDIRNGRELICSTQLIAWDIHNIEYLSVKYSNDFRSSPQQFSLQKIVRLYRDYENTHSVASDIKNADSSDKVLSLIMGMTAEQFPFQSKSWIFERFNRSYYILLSAEDFEHRDLIDTNAILQSVLGCSADEYVAILLIVFWLCTNSPLPLSAPESIYRKKEDTIFTKENVRRFIEYYSCTYEELRNSKYEAQLLYSKPFIKTHKRGEYCLSSMFLVSMILANGIYWIVRDYYHKQNSQKFVDAFGLLFEDYIKDLARSYCNEEEWYVIPQGKTKGADFVFSLGKARLIVEAKTALLQIAGRKQVPDGEAINQFFERTIRKACEQLERSYAEICSNSDSNLVTLKVVLLYDEFSNTAIIESALRESFSIKTRCFVMTIREFEMLLYFHHNEPEKRDEILKIIGNGLEGLVERKSFGSVYDELELHNNPHMKGEMDYAKKMLKMFSDQLIESDRRE